MKKGMLNTYIKFMMTLLLIVGLIYLINLFMINSVHKKFYPEKISTLILGDSHTIELNEKIIDNSVNLSQAGDTYRNMYFKLNESLNHSEVSKVVLAFSYNNFTYLSEHRSVQTYETFKRNYAISNLYSLYTNSDNTNYCKVVFTNLFSINRLYLHHFISSSSTDALPFDSNKKYISYSALEKYYSKLDQKKDKYTKHSLDKKIKHHFNFLKKGEVVSQTSELYFKKILELCQQENIDITLLTMPLSEEYIDAVPDSFTTHFNEMKTLSQEYSNLKVFDFGSYFKNQTEYLKDFDHVNGIGGAIISRKL